MILGVSMNDYRKELMMHYSLQNVIDLTGASDKEEFIDAFKGKSEQEIKDILSSMFPGEPLDQIFVDEIKIYAETS